MRCMISANATGAIGEWRDNLPGHIRGNRLGDPSRLYVVTPPGDVLAESGPVVYLEPDYVLDDSGEPDIHASILNWLGIVGPVLNAGGNFVIIGEVWVWRILHNTPHWRMWCMMYEGDDDPQFTADKAAIGIPDDFTMLQAREAVAGQFAGQS